MTSIPLLPDLSVLVVEPSPYVRQIVREMLFRAGVRRIQETADGADGFGRLARLRPDLTLLDWDAPTLSGDEFVRLARAPASDSAAMPIVLMLANPRRSVIERARAMGVAGVVAKPFSPRILWMRLEAVVSGARPCPPTSARSVAV